jgi:hypothetical protein
MKTKTLLLAALCLLVNVLHAAPLGTAFTYQGYLSGAGAAANGNYDLQFGLFDAASNGNPVGPTLTNLDVVVNNGFFLVTLDFGNVFDGNARWMALGVRTNGNATAPFAALLPLQPLSPTPYALYATNAGAAGPDSITASQLSTPGGSPAAGQVLAYNGTNLVWTTAGGGSSNAWSLAGNAGTSPTLNFVGTTDNNALLFRVNGVRAWEMMPTADAPNVIGGAPGNFVASGMQGATIGGGGTITTYGQAYSNSIFAYHGTIGGGLGNTIQANAYESTIAGGNQNSVQNGAHDSAIGGGYFNTIQTNAYYSTIAGGDGNGIQGSANHSFIGGGGVNTIETNSNSSTIVGGIENTIGTDAEFSTLVGGEVNSIQNGAVGAFIGGGEFNNIETNSNDSIVAGGYDNAIQSGGSTIAGGFYNLILSNADYSSIAGGRQNNIQKNAVESVIGGGYGNIIQTGANDSTIGGGSQNNIAIGASSSIIAAGDFNTNGSPYSTVSGGSNNAIYYYTPYSTIGGGIGNGIYDNSQAATICGGLSNSIEGQYATIAGGLSNTASANSFVAGTQANAQAKGDFVWSDTSAPTSTVNPNQFVARASGGVIFYSSAGGAGVYLAPNATAWTTLSDRSAKKNIMPVDYHAVLDKLAKVPIQQWNYKWQKDTDVPNLGPMAQDFIAAFYPGRDDKGITTLEFDGVELAAIQGLNQKLAEQDKKLEAAIKEKDARIAQLEKEMADIKFAQHQTAAQWEARFDALQKVVARVADKSEGVLAVTAPALAQ